MQSLVFKCPRTGLNIDSEIGTDRRTLSRIQGVRFSLRCPHCKRAHRLRIDGDCVLAMDASAPATGGPTASLN